MMNNLFSKVVETLKWLPYMPISIYFCFKYLPLKQAIYVPIWLYKPHLGHLGGSVSILPAMGG